MKFLKIQVLLCLAIISCASPQSPTGGLKDTLAPSLIIDSMQFITNTIPQSLRLSFNENVVINEKEIVILPKIQPNPKINIHNTYLKIDFDKNSLQPNTTYSIQLKKGVKDLNESNIGTYPNLFFSTGEKIDSNILRVTKLNYYDVTASYQITNKKGYIVQNKDTITKIPGLVKNEKLNILGYIDLNKNEVFDTTEPADIIETINDSILMYFINNNNKIIYKNKNIIYNLPVYEILKNNIAYFKDTILISNELEKLNKNYYTIKENKDSIPFSIEFLQPIIKEKNDKTLIKINKIIEKIDDNKIILILNNKDTIKGKLFTEYNNININDTSILPVKLIVVEKSILINGKYYPLKNRSFDIEKRGNITIKSKENKHIFIIQNNKIIYSLKINKNDKKELIIKSGNYDFLIFNDIDNNHHINHPLEKGSRETYQYKKNISVINNIENVVEL